MLPSADLVGRELNLKYNVEGIFFLFPENHQGVTHDVFLYYFHDVFLYYFHSWSRQGKCTQIVFTKFLEIDYDDRFRRIKY